MILVCLQNSIRWYLISECTQEYKFRTARQIYWKYFIFIGEFFIGIDILFNTGWNFIQCAFDNVIYSVLLLFMMFWEIMINTSKRIQVLVNNACITTWDLLPKWKTIPLLHSEVKKQYMGSHGARKYSWNLCASKKSCFNKCNCKSGRHNSIRRKVSTVRPTSVHHKVHKICH